MNSNLFAFVFMSLTNKKKTHLISQLNTHTHTHTHTLTFNNCLDNHYRLTQINILSFMYAFIHSFPHSLIYLFYYFVFNST